MKINQQSPFEKIHNNWRGVNPLRRKKMLWEAYFAALYSDMQERTHHYLSITLAFICLQSVVRLFSDQNISNRLATIGSFLLILYTVGLITLTKKPWQALD
ncbi:MAG: hypothetical protein HN736_19140 [Anaerolineae bacterium]|jgi:hypothetical protein|nr:hypothetical protein [Anaerolineae bacterium]MBT4308951.1 hypothetical protein [Anaerolineae bacterium]MBT6062033.1 hypothetical protein [Anaerolineae bacterium]MBT7776812.1 hypothetical protein [Anaerolineae bacterium]